MNCLVKGELAYMKEDEMMEQGGVYVWNPTNREPRLRHQTSGAAISEAARMADKHPDHTFYVIKVLAAYRIPKQPTFGDLKVGERFKHDDRTLIKTDPVAGQIMCGAHMIYGVIANALRLAPSALAGRNSLFSDDTIVEKL